MSWTRPTRSATRGESSAADRLVSGPVARMVTGWADRRTVRVMSCTADSGAWYGGRSPSPSAPVSTVSIVATSSGGAGCTPAPVAPSATGTRGRPHCSRTLRACRSVRLGSPKPLLFTVTARRSIRPSLCSSHR